MLMILWVSNMRDTPGMICPCSTMKEASAGGLHWAGDVCGSSPETVCLALAILYMTFVRNAMAKVAPSFTSLVPALRC